jgi:hypothetical protein
MNKDKNYRLELGQQVDVHINIFSRSIALSYTGQVSDYVYSIAVIIAKGNNSYAYNIYFNADQKEFSVLNGKIRIGMVDAQFIEFSYIK